MTRFVLTIVDDQRAILTTEDRVETEEYQALRRAFNAWMHDGGVAVLADCRVNDIRQTTVTLEVAHEDVGVVPVGPVPQGVVADDGYDS